MPASVWTSSIPPARRLRRRGDSTLAIDVADAAAGRWQFRAATEKAPYPAFPAVMAVATSVASADSASAKMNPTIVKAGNVRFEIINLGNKTVVKQARALRIAVTKPQFDDMGKLLGALGMVTAINRSTGKPCKPEALDPFDVLFLTCAGWPAVWGKTTNPKSSAPVSPAEKCGPK